MQAVGRILSQGVYTVSGPFHPFGGAVDIVVVEQQDGSFKSSPWYVRFGKFQGVLKAKEKVIDICVNGVLADFQMHLDSKGEAFFLREIDAQEEANLIFPSSSVDDAVDNSLPQSLSSIRSKSCNYDAASEVVGRSSSRGSRILGLVFGRRSLKSQDVEGDVDTQGIGNTVGSLERAEIAANLLDIKWSTNLSEDKGQDVLANSSEDAKVVVENGELNEKVVYDIAESDVQVACVKVEVQACLEKGLNGQEEVSIDNSNETSETSKLGVDCSSGLACVKVEEVQACLEKELNGEGEVSIDNSNEKSETSKLGVDCSSELPCVKVEVQACVEKELNGEEEISIDNSNETSETSKLGVDCSSEQAHELMYLAGPGCEEVHVHVHDKDLQGATVLLAEGTEAEEVIENADLGMPASEVSEFHSQVQQTDCSDSDDIMYSEVIVEEQLTSPKPQTVKMGLGDYSNEKVEPNCVIKPSSCRSLDDQALDENNMKNKDVSSTLSSPLDSVDDCLPRKTSRRSPSPSSEDEKIFFSDLDKSVINDGFERSFSPEHVDKEDHVSYENDTEKLTAISIPIVIPRNEVVGEEVEKYSISLPNISSTSDIMVPHDVRYPLSLSLDSKSTSLPWTFPGKDDDLECLNSDEDKRNQLSHEEPGAKDYNGSGDFKGDPSTHDPPPGGNWRIWPFSLRRAASRKSMLPPPSLSDTKNTTFVNSPENTISVDMDKTDLKPNIMKKKVKEMAPTSEQVASLNLKNGMNTVTFTFSTAVLGKQQVDCRIYLWKWNTRIVISDVDGTITRSDVLGQFMPLVGIDWSQTGVAHLFSAIKENGYQLLFLSARSISQAYITRQFLLNLKQDGKVLPDGPVVISPDGLFPSLYREVIRRVPHEFKIACLEDIKALFPSDSNPFYAGFGNRDTDEISYLKVGIPLGKIFIINPKFAGRGGCKPSC